MLIAKSALLFVLGGLAEIGGGYLVWTWLRRAEPVALGLIGAGLLVAYGVIQTLQPAHFGRVYAAYGGVFVVMSVLWGWLVDHRRPDAYDIVGALVVIVGVGIMMYWPRGAAQ